MSTNLSTSDRVQQDTQTKDRIVEDVESYAKSSFGLGNSNVTQKNVVKVLGQNWNIDSDEFFFDFDNLNEYAATFPSTKRSILKVTPKIFHPLGFLSPVTVVMKILFQKLCIDKVEWDEELKGDILGEWKKILGTLRCFEVNKIPRCYFEFKPIDVQFHGFSDASDRAYAAVVYVRSCYEDRCEVACFKGQGIAINQAEHPKTGVTRSSSFSTPSRPAEISRTRT